GACVAHLGPDGAGHFVKMVHNGIEYGIMQLLAESYDLLSRGAGLEAQELAATFEDWNQGLLSSFLLDITAAIFSKKDDVSGDPLVEKVLDRAGQKGTGRWTAMEAFELGVPVPTLTAAVEARVISSRKEERAAAGRILASFQNPALPADRAAFVSDLRDAFLAGSLCAYAQGLNLIRAASGHFDWQVPLDEVARVWMGGCIIRSGMLGPIREAYRQDPDLANLPLAASFRKLLRETEPGFRRSVAAAAEQGIPVPAFGASLAWFDGTRTPRLPQNLTQAQRDAFGAHTYLRLDQPEGKPIHSDWLEQQAIAPGKGNA
ncbi:MAG: NADP-dependent phosphogluconate dehydrogenase, partial [Planctomycetota bacterium]